MGSRAAQACIDYKACKLCRGEKTSCNHPPRSGSPVTGCNGAVDRQQLDAGILCTAACDDTVGACWHPIDMPSELPEGLHPLQQSLPEPLWHAMSEVVGMQEHRPSMTPCRLSSAFQCPRAKCHLCVIMQAR